jgi:ribosomal protein L22
MTEKQYAPTKTEKKNTQAVKTPKQKDAYTPAQKKENADEKKQTIEETKTEKESAVKKIEVKKIKKTEAVVNSFLLPISTKTAGAICRFIKGKTIEKAIQDLGEVVKLKKAIPMRGEIPHRKGKGMMSGRFPKEASKHFIILLKALKGNSNVNGLENPVISEGIPNLASRPYGSFGRIRRKRTHVTIKAVEKKMIKANKEKKNN